MRKRGPLIIPRNEPQPTTRLSCVRLAIEGAQVPDLYVLETNECHASAPLVPRPSADTLADLWSSRGCRRQLPAISEAHLGKLLYLPNLLLDPVQILQPELGAHTDQCAVHE